jgi:hypothetical protein
MALWLVPISWSKEFLGSYQKCELFLEQSLQKIISQNFEWRMQAKAGVTRATKLLQLATKSDFNAC